MIYTKKKVVKFASTHDYIYKYFSVTKKPNNDESKAPLAVS